MEIEEKETNSAAKRGELIAVCSAKGGIGRTVLAVNLAVSLSKKRLSVSVFDGDFQFGDVSLVMDLHPTFTIKDVAEAMDGMDAHTLSSYLIRHGSGVKVMAAPERPEQADLITSTVTERVCEMLCSQHDYVIVDTGVGLQESTLAFIEKADQVLILTTLEMTAIRGAKAMLDTMELLGMRSKAQIVVNRSTMESVIKATDVPDILGEETPAYIPNDFQIVSQSLNIGVPFVQNHGKTEISKAVFKIAEQMISRREIAVFQPKQPSFLQSLFHKTKGTTSIF